MNTETRIAAEWFKGNASAAEWAAAVVEAGGGAGLRAHVARWAAADPSSMYAQLLTCALERVDYEALGVALQGGGVGQ